MAVAEVAVILAEMQALHDEKSAGYGSDQDPLHNFNGVAKVAGEKNFYYPMLRITEKMVRAINLYEADRLSATDLGEELKDVALLAVLAEAMRRQYTGTDADRTPQAFVPNMTRKVNEAFIRREIKTPILNSPLLVDERSLEATKVLDEDLLTPDVSFTPKPEQVDLVESIQAATRNATDRWQHRHSKEKA